MPHMTEYGSYGIDVDNACDVKCILRSAFRHSGDSWNLSDFAKWINKNDSGLDDHLRTSFINVKAANKLADELDKRKDEFIEMQKRYNEIDEEIEELEESKNDLANNLETKLKGWVKLIKEQQDATK
jgi:predicted RNase H-like nuclease (RuvC/YqgF family)